VKFDAAIQLCIPTVNQIKSGAFGKVKDMYNKGFFKRLYRRMPIKWNGKKAWRKIGELPSLPLNSIIN
jgi:hypothetical protein